jgi:branched-chain amino acid aminotransferase
MPQTKGTYICYSGEYVEKDKFSLPLANRAFLYADGFFETILSKGTDVPLFSYHYKRIKHAFDLYQFNPQSLPSKDNLLSKISGLLNRNKYFKLSRIKIVFFREEGGLYTPENNNAGYLVLTNELEKEEFELNKTGLGIDVYSELRKSVDKFSSVKNINSVLYTQAGIERKNQKADDLIILNNRNEICESISSNIFIFFKNKLYTPELNSGCIAGVMRQFLIDKLANSNHAVTETQINLNHLNDAEEIFITNTIQGISWIGSFRTKRYYHFLSDQLIRMLNKELIHNTH